MENSRLLRIKLGEKLEKLGILTKHGKRTVLLGKYGKRAELARELGISVSTLHRYLNNERWVEIEDAKKIADFLGIDIKQLLNDEDVKRMQEDLLKKSKRLQNVISK